MQVVSLEKWLESMTTAENLVKVRKDGLCYIEESKLPMARTIAMSVGVDFDDWLRRYWDYAVYL